MRSLLSATVALSMIAFVGACGDAGTLGDPAQGPYCDKGQRFDYIFNGRLAHDAQGSVINVADYSEIVVYLETRGECQNSTDVNSETVHLLFRLDESSPWGRSGQAFSFSERSGTGGRFHVDGRYMKLEAICDGTFSFEYSVAGVSCAK